MASKSLASGLNEELTCPICLELFKVPKLLPCLHFFCKECLKELVEKSTGKSSGALECPKCRTQHDLPPKGVEGFSTNFTITNLVELLNIHTDEDSLTTTPVPVLKCENEVDDNPAASKCLDCNYYLCEECTTLHKKQRATKHHKIASLKEIKKGEVKQLEQKRYCSDHEGEELKLYCRTCREVICRDCTIVTHKQHNYTFVKDVREELVNTLEGLTASLMEKNTEFQSAVDRIHQFSQEEQKKVASNKAKIRAFFDDRVVEVQKHIATLQQHIKNLQQHESVLLSEVDVASTSHLKQLTAQEGELQLSHAHISSALTFSRQLPSSATTTDLAIMSKQVFSQLQALAQFQLDKDPVDRSTWLLGLSKEKPLSSQVIPAFTDAIVVSKLANPALLGKNTFQISLKNIPATFNMEVDVKVSLPSHKSCPVKIQPSDPQPWSVSYFISPPCPNQVVVTVTVNGVQPRESPFQLQCHNELAIGTKVQKLQVKGQQKRGTVVQPPQTTIERLLAQAQVPGAYIQWDSGAGWMLVDSASLQIVPE